MNGTDIAAIVSSVGFPILACIYLAKYFKTIMEQHRQELKEQQERHDAEIKEQQDRHRAEMKEARQEYADQIKEIMQQHKDESDTMRTAIDRIADGLQDVREMIRQIITPTASGLKPPDDSWNE